VTSKKFFKIWIDCDALTLGEMGDAKDELVLSPTSLEVDDPFLLPLVLPLVLPLLWPVVRS
jgi:hypothetical protein